MLQLVVQCIHEVAGRRPGSGVSPFPDYRPATSWVHCTSSCNTQSSDPEDGRDQCPKHVELNGIINKPLLLHLVGVHIIYVSDASQTNIKHTASFIKTNLLDNGLRGVV